MRHLQLVYSLVICLFIFSCDSDDDTQAEISNEAGIAASINGGTYTNYSFSDTIYEITPGPNGNTMSIDAGDINGDQITIFLNSTSGFNNGAVKNMGDTDSNNFRTYLLIRQAQTQLNYNSISGSVTITNNRSHPTKNGYGLISGTFNVTAETLDQSQATNISGSFTDLEYSN